MQIQTTRNFSSVSIECTAEELRQSTSLSDGLYNAFRHAFNGSIFYPSHNDTESEDTENEDKAD